MRNAFISQNRARKYGAEDILARKLTRMRMALAEKAANPQEDFNDSELETYIENLRDCVSDEVLFEQEVENARSAIKNDHADYVPDLSNPELQLLWATALLYIDRSKQPVHSHMYGGGQTHYQKKNVATTALWEQITESPYAKQTMHQHATYISEELRRNDARFSWGVPGSGFKYRPDENIINIDFLMSLISGLEHAHSTMFREIGRSQLSTKFPEKNRQIREEMQALKDKYEAQKAAGKKLSDKEYKHLRKLALEWEMRKMLWEAAEKCATNRYTERKGQEKAQEYGYSLNHFMMTNSHFGSEMLAYLRDQQDGGNRAQLKELAQQAKKELEQQINDLASQGGDDIPPEMLQMLRDQMAQLDGMIEDGDSPERRFMNVLHAVELSFFKNNGLFKSNAANWKKFGVKPDHIKIKKEGFDLRDVFQAANDNNGPAALSADFEYLMELCGGLKGLENLQPRSRDRWHGRPYFNTLTDEYADKRNRVIEHIWDLYISDIADELLNNLEQQLEEELGNEQDGQDQDGQDQEGQEGQDGQGQDGEGQDGEGQEGQEGQDGQGQDGQGQDGQGQQGQGQQGQQSGDPSQGQKGDPSQQQDGKPSQDQNGDPSQGQDGNQQSQDPSQQQDGDPSQGQGEQSQQQDGDQSQGQDGQGQDQEGQQGQENQQGQDGQGQDGQEGQGQQQDYGPQEKPFGDEQSQNQQQGQQQGQDGQGQKQDQNFDPSQAGTNQDGSKMDVENNKGETESMPDVDVPPEHPEGQEPGQDADGQGQDADGQGQEGAEGKTLEQIKKELEEAMKKLQEEMEQQGQDGEGQDGQDGQEGDGQDGQSQEGGEGEGDTPSDSAGDGGEPKTLEEIASMEWKSYAALMMHLKGYVNKTARVLQKVRDMQLEKTVKRSPDLEMLPEGKEMDRFDADAHQNLIVKKVTGQELEKEDLHRFQKDERHQKPTTIDIVLLIDGSGSMTMSSYNVGKANPMEVALISSIILYEAAKQVDANVFIALWGNDDPIMLAKPGDDEREVERNILKAKDGMNCGTNLAPSIKKISKVLSEHKSTKYSGYTHMMVISDGDISDPDPAVDAVHTLLSGSDYTTLEFAILKKNDATVSQMENVAERIKIGNPTKKIGVHRDGDPNSIPAGIVGLIFQKIRVLKSFTAVPWAKKKKQYQQVDRRFGMK